MSRLDDELRIAFRREQPPADFAARVLARLDEPLPQKKPGFFSAMVSFFQAPQLRWAALGAVATLVVAIFLLWQLTPRQTVIDSKPVVATTDSAPDAESTKDENKAASESEKPKDEQIIKTGNETVKNERKAAPVKYRRQVVARQVAPKVDPEAEAAKQQVLFALQLASNTFGDAQRAIQSDSHKPNTVPNR